MYYDTGLPWCTTNENIKLSATSVTNALGVPVPIGPVAQRVLVADATLNGTPGLSGNSDVYSYMVKYNWTDVDGGYMYNGQTKGHISAHMKTATIPEGGSLGMLDGHVEWRPFNQMINRVGAGEPWFYW
jgi:hypothetical protein